MSLLVSPRQSAPRDVVKSAKEISELAGILGTTQGLRFVQSEIESYCSQISYESQGFSAEEIASMDNALHTLGLAILSMRRVVTAILADAGVSSNYVG